MEHGTRLKEQGERQKEQLENKNTMRPAPCFFEEDGADEVAEFMGHSGFVYRTIFSLADTL